MTRRVLIAVVCTLLTVAAPAVAQDGVTLIPPSAAGQVDVPLGKQAKPFGVKAAARSARRAASCTVAAVAGGSWTGTADVTRGKRVDRVLYELVGG